jgi:hypothetical protein
MADCQGRSRGKDVLEFTAGGFWWRRRELNPRPKKPAVKSLRVYPVLSVQRLPKKPARATAA